MSQYHKPIIFFDGVCALCNKFIDWLFKVDSKRDKLRFATLQGATAKELIPKDVLVGLNTMVFYIDGKLYYRSTGVLKVLSSLSWYYRWLSIFLILPKGLRDSFYNWVAKNRYKWFGEKETCRLPTAEERAKFLD